METLFFAQKAFIVKKRRLLIIRKSPSARFCGGLWEVPGGRMQPSERVEEHLAREVFEEVGIEVDAVEPFYLWDWLLRIDSETSHHIVAAAVYCTPRSDSVTMANQVPDDDIDCCRWVDFAELSDYEFIPNMIPVVREFLNRYGTTP